MTEMTVEEKVDKSKREIQHHVEFRLLTCQPFTHLIRAIIARIGNGSARRTHEMVKSRETGGKRAHIQKGKCYPDPKHDKEIICMLQIVTKGNRV